MDKNCYCKNGLINKNDQQIRVMFVKIPILLVTELARTTLKLRKSGKAKIAQKILSKRNKTGDIPRLSYKLDCKSHGNQNNMISWYGHRNRCGQEWNEKKRHQTSPCIYV